MRSRQPESSNTDMFIVTDTNWSSSPSPRHAYSTVRIELHSLELVYAPVPPIDPSPRSCSWMSVLLRTATLASRESMGGNLVIPLVVLKELDGLKNRDGEVGYNARSLVCLYRRFLLTLMCTLLSPSLLVCTLSSHVVLFSLPLFPTCVPLCDTSKYTMWRIQGRDALSA
jgi:hypothetical protein